MRLAAGPHVHSRGIYRYRQDAGGFALGGHQKDRQVALRPYPGGPWRHTLRILGPGVLGSRPRVALPSSGRRGCYHDFAFRAVRTQHIVAGAPPTPNILWFRPVGGWFVWAAFWSIDRLATAPYPQALRRRDWSNIAVGRVPADVCDWCDWPGVGCLFSVSDGAAGHGGPAVDARGCLDGIAAIGLDGRLTQPRSGHPSQRSRAGGGHRMPVAARGGAARRRRARDCTSHGWRVPLRELSAATSR